MATYKTPNLNNKPTSTSRDIECLLAAKQLDEELKTNRLTKMGITPPRKSEKSNYLSCKERQEKSAYHRKVGKLYIEEGTRPAGNMAIMSNEGILLARQLYGEGKAKEMIRLFNSNSKMRGKISRELLSFQSNKCAAEEMEPV